MPYGELIREAFRIAGGHRYLWPFGIFAGGSTGFNLNIGGNGRTGDAHIDPSVFRLIGVTVLVFGLLFFIGSVIAQGALPKAVVAIRGGERPAFRGTWRAGLSSFWQVLVFALLLLACAIALLFVALLGLGLPLGITVAVVFAATHDTVARVLVVVGVVLIAVVVFFVVFLALFVVVQHGFREVVLGGRTPVDALRRGWRLARARVGQSIVLILIQQGLTIGAGIALTLAMGLLALPAIILAIGGFGTATVIVIVVSAIVLIPLALTGIGAIGTFSHTFWTLAYLRLVSPPPPPAQPLPSERPY